MLVPFFGNQEDGWQLATVAIDLQPTTDPQVISLVRFVDLFKVDVCSGRQLSPHHDVDATADQFLVGLQRRPAARNGLIQLLLGVLMPALQQPDFKFVASRRMRVRLIPDGHLGGRLVDNLSLRWNLTIAEVAGVVHPGIHCLATDEVIVVSELNVGRQHYVLLVADQLVKLLQFWKTLGLHLLGPVVGCGQAQRPRGKESSQFDIAGADPQAAGIFTAATTLHGGRDHHGGH